MPLILSQTTLVIYWYIRTNKQHILKNGSNVLKCGTRLLFAFAATLDNIANVEILVHIREVSQSRGFESCKKRDSLTSFTFLHGMRRLARYPGSSRRATMVETYKL